jgi:hypothetical protein
MRWHKLFLLCTTDYDNYDTDLDNSVFSTFMLTRLSFVMGIATYFNTCTMEMNY